MPEVAKIKLRLPLNSGSSPDALVEIGGEVVTPAIRGLVLSAHVHEFTSLQLDLPLAEGNVEGEAVLSLSVRTEYLMRKLGWSPTKEAAAIALQSAAKALEAFAGTELNAASAAQLVRDMAGEVSDVD